MGIAGSNRRDSSGQSKPAAKKTAAGKSSAKKTVKKPVSEVSRDRTKSKIKVAIPSIAPETKHIQRQVMAELAHFGFNHQSTFAIKVALDEAITNALKHGNQLDAKKKIYIQATITPQRAEFVIEDEGSGFKRTEVPDPTLDENLEKSSGRGIHLIEAYMNEAEWSRGGRRLRMMKRNEADVYPRSGNI
jgi:serine/threonine-protein kinase RsbW